jgi:hypothetical protein
MSAARKSSQAPLAATFCVVHAAHRDGQRILCRDVCRRGDGPKSEATSASQNLQVIDSSGTAAGQRRYEPRQSASLNGFVPFPSGNLESDISSAPLDANSSAIIIFVGSGIARSIRFRLRSIQRSSIGIHV